MAWAQIEKDEQYRYFIARRDPDNHEPWRAPLVEIPDDVLEAYSAVVQAEQRLCDFIIETYGTSYGDEA